MMVAESVVEEFEPVHRPTPEIEEVAKNGVDQESQAATTTATTITAAAGPNDDDKQLVEEAKEEEQKVEKEIQNCIAEQNDENVRKQLEFVLKRTEVFKNMIVQRLKVESVANQDKPKRGGRKRKNQVENEPGPTRKSARLKETKKPDSPPQVVATLGTRRTNSPHQRKRRSTRRTPTPVPEEEDDVKEPVEVEEEKEEPEPEPKTDESGLKFTDYFTGGTLRPYQVEGVKWLNSLFVQGVNGILADEMGLGKTAQTIGMISHLYAVGYCRQPFLVVVPLSTLGNWRREFQRFAPQLPLVVYHGGEKKREYHRRHEFGAQYELEGKNFYVCPVVITSYEMVIRDGKKLQRFEFGFFVLDEGHSIKNYSCVLHKTLKSLKLANRLLLTGTPLQNNLTELWSLLNFLMPKIFNQVDWFLSFFDFSEITEHVPTTGSKGRAKFKRSSNRTILDQQKSNQMVTKLHDILGAFMLRREKKDVELHLPPKKEILLYAPMTEKQLWMQRLVIEGNICKTYGKGRYDDDETSLIVDGKRKRNSVNYGAYFDDSNFDLKDLDEVEANEELYNQQLVSAVKPKEDDPRQIRGKLCNLRSFKQVLMTLRHIINHPHIIEWPVDDEDQYIVDERTVNESGKMMLLDQLLMALKQQNQGHKVLIFSQFTKVLNIIHDYCNHYRGFRVARLDGTMSLDERDLQMDQFSDDPNTFMMLVSTRAGGLGINLTAADTVIIFDSDWNPQCDLQAQDRCHRIGQTKPVLVYRFAAGGTVDQELVERAQRKRRFEKMVIHSGRYTLSGGAVDEAEEKCLGLEDLQELMNSNDHSTAVDGKAISKEDLERILDRSDEAMKTQEGRARGFNVLPSDHHVL